MFIEREDRRMRALPVGGEKVPLMRESMDDGGPMLNGDVLYLSGINRHRVWRIVTESARKAGSCAHSLAGCCECNWSKRLMRLFWKPPVLIPLRALLWLQHPRTKNRS